MDAFRECHLLQRIPLQLRNTVPWHQAHRQRQSRLRWLMCDTRQGPRDQLLPYICHLRIGAEGETKAGGKWKHHVTEHGGRCWGRGESPEDQHKPPKNGDIPPGNRWNNGDHDGWGQKKI